MHLKFVTFLTRTCIFIFFPTPRQFAWDFFFSHIPSVTWMVKVFSLPPHSFALHFMKNKVAESSLRIMYLLALLCSEIGGNLFSTFLFFSFISFIQRHQCDATSMQDETFFHLFLKLPWKEECLKGRKKSWEKLWVRE